MKIACIAIDDEPRALEVMVKFIEQVPFLELHEQFRNPLKAFEYVKNNPVDLIFLDINMPNLSGLQFIRSLSAQPLVILTTAYSEYAVESYGLDVLDYLLKPFEFDRFLQSANKAFDRIKTLQYKGPSIPSTPEPSNEQEEFIFVKDGSQLVRILKEDVLFIEASGNYQVIHLGKKKILSLIRMDDLLRSLGNKGFIRVHKSFAVNISKIESIDNHRIYLAGKVIPISSSYRKPFYAAIQSSDF